MTGKANGAKFQRSLIKVRWHWAGPSLGWSPLGLVAHIKKTQNFLIFIRFEKSLLNLRSCMKEGGVLYLTLFSFITEVSIGQGCPGVLVLLGTAGFTVYFPTCFSTPLTSTANLPHDLTSPSVGWKDKKNPSVFFCPDWEARVLNEQSQEVKNIFL